MFDLTPLRFVILNLTEGVKYNFNRSVNFYEPLFEILNNNIITVARISVYSASIEAR